MDEKVKKRRIRNILLIAGTLAVIAVIILIIWLVDKYDVTTTRHIGEEVEYGKAAVTVDGVEFTREYGEEIAKEGAVFAKVYITLSGEVNLLELQVAGGDRVPSSGGTFGGESYAASPEGDANSGKYELVFLAVENADAYLFIGEKDRVFLGTAIVLHPLSTAS